MTTAGNCFKIGKQPDSPEKAFVKHRLWLYNTRVMRLNKFIAESGICSRREADRLIEEGRITVNGVPAQQGMQVEETDTVLADGKLLKRSEERMLVFYKPAGVVCTDSEKDHAVTVREYLKQKEHLFCVGRLDKESEGLLLLTNMGDLAEKIARAGDVHEKEYVVVCRRPLSGAFIDRMRRGVTIRIPENRSTTGAEEEYTTRPCRVDRLDDRTFRIILTEGKNRQIRRMCEALGNKVESLKRVRIMNILLGDLERGAVREAEPEELNTLKKLAGAGEITEK